MPVSGIAITTTGDATIEKVCAALAQDERVQVGPINGRRIAVAIETDSQQEDDALRQWIQQIPDVEHIDIAFVHFDDDAATAARGSERAPSDDRSCM